MNSPSLDPASWPGEATPLQRNAAPHTAPATSHAPRWRVDEVDWSRIDQRRIDGVDLTAAGFLNLTQDHLDYHVTMGAYRTAKLRLFSEVLPADGVAVVNADSPEAGHFVQAARARGRGDRT